MAEKREKSLEMTRVAIYGEFFYMYSFSPESECEVYETRIFSFGFSIFYYFCSFFLHTVSSVLHRIARFMKFIYVQRTGI